MRAIQVMSFFILSFLGVFTATAFATTASPVDALPDIAKSIFDAVSHGQWWVAAASAVIMLCAIARKYLPVSWKSGVKGDIIGMSLAFAMAFAGVIATWGLAPGAVMTFGVAAMAAKIGLGAIGGYTIIHKIAGWLIAWGALPSWAVAMLRMVSMFAGSDAVKKAEAAGEAAVIATPSTGLAGKATIREVE